MPLHSIQIVIQSLSTSDQEKVKDKYYSHLNPKYTHLAIGHYPEGATKLRLCACFIIGLGGYTSTKLEAITCPECKKSWKFIEEDIRRDTDASVL